MTSRSARALASLDDVCERQLGLGHKSARVANIGMLEFGLKNTTE